MAITVLGPGGYSRPSYGSFAGKGSDGRSGNFTVLGPGGYPRPPYSVALFKTKSSGQIRTHPFFATMGQLRGF